MTREELLWQVTPGSDGQMSAAEMAEAMYPESDITYGYQAVREAYEYGYAAAENRVHQERAEKAEQAIQRVRWQCDSWSHGNSWNKAARNAILRAMDGGER